MKNAFEHAFALNLRCNNTQNRHAHTCIHTKFTYIQETQKLNDAKLFKLETT